MAEVLLFHHALGLTAGCLAFADELRAAGHIVHAPDLYDGKTFTPLTDGVGYAEQLGFATIIERGWLAAAGLPTTLVYAGFSLGVMPAQLLAQTRVPPAEFGGPWPEGVPLQIHTLADDAWGDVEIARQLAATVAGAELFLYPGDRHLFADNSLPDYDEAAATLLKQRVLRFLGTL